MQDSVVQNDFKEIFESFQEMEERIIALEEADKPLTKNEIENLIKIYSEQHKKSLIAELRKIINEP